MDRTEDKILVAGLRKGSREAFEKLYQLYASDIYAFSMSLLKSKALAEDVVQEVFLKVWLKRSEINPDLSFRSFIFTIARNLAFNTLAKAANHSKLREVVFYKSQKKESTVEEKLMEEHYEKLKDRAIRELTPSCKRVFEMSRKEGKSYQEISEELGVSINTVKNQISIALNAIRIFLAKHGDITFLLLFFMELYPL